MRMVTILAVAVMSACPAGANEPAPPQSAGQPPFITHNPDGTFTIQKQPSKKAAKGAKDKGLVIPPQTIVPFATAPKTKQGG